MTKWRIFDFHFAIMAYSFRAYLPFCMLFALLFGLEQVLNIPCKQQIKNKQNKKP
jgi:hypothetical protein